jgi:hypothetical protein
MRAMSKSGLSEVGHDQESRALFSASQPRQMLGKCQPFSSPEKNDRVTVVPQKETHKPAECDFGIFSNEN